ncbi:hypothetical protein PMI09_05341 [Rhizobium sp. CF122]|nr:hypothetical protein PMI09_05341 [Rhizobium sp. CF122]
MELQQFGVGRIDVAILLMSETKSAREASVRVDLSKTRICGAIFLPTEP